MDLSDIDLLDRDRFAQGVPHDWFSYLRQHAPVYKHPEPNGPGFWVVTKYDDVVTVGRDGTTYSSDQKRGGVVVLEEPEIEVNFEQGGNLLVGGGAEIEVPRAHRPHVGGNLEAHELIVTDVVLRIRGRRPPPPPPRFVNDRRSETWELEVPRKARVAIGNTAFQRSPDALLTALAEIRAVLGVETVQDVDRDEAKDASDERVRKAGIEARQGLSVAPAEQRRAVRIGILEILRDGP